MNKTPSKAALAFGNFSPVNHRAYYWGFLTDSLQSLWERETVFGALGGTSSSWHWWEPSPALALCALSAETSSTPWELHQHWLWMWHLGLSHITGALRTDDIFKSQIPLGVLQEPGPHFSQGVLLPPTGLFPSSCPHLALCKEDCLWNQIKL